MGSSSEPSDDTNPRVLTFANNMLMMDDSEFSISKGLVKLETFGMIDAVRNAWKLTV
jgi:hypothetical protein